MVDATKNLNDTKTLQEVLCDACLDLSSSLDYRLLYPEGGAPSTTFTLGVFALPHLNKEVKLCGFNSACRPTDIDGGLHLPVFGQFYLCSNIFTEDLEERSIDFVKKVISKISSYFKLDISEVEIEALPYNWEADSTGYTGRAHELNIRRIQLNNNWITLGGIEVAQANEFSQSGLKKGRASELIVIGVDRLISVINLAQILANKDSNTLKHISLSQLYPQFAYHPTCRQAYSPDMIEQTILRFSVQADDPVSLYKRLQKSVENLRVKSVKLLHGVSLHRYMQALAILSRLLEQAFAGRAIASETRINFIHKIRRLYSVVVDTIVNNPNHTLAEIEKTIRTFSDCYPGLHFFSKSKKVFVPQLSLVSLPTLFLNTIEQNLLLENIQKNSLASILKIEMLSRLWAIDCKQIGEVIYNSILVDGENSFDKKTNLESLLQLLPFSEKDRQRVNQAICAIQQAEASLTIRVYPNYKAILGRIFDIGEGSLSEICYNLHCLNDLQSLTLPVEIAVVLLDRLDRAIRSIRCLGYVPRGNKSDWLAIRQSRNIVMMASQKLELSNQEISLLINKLLELNKLNSILAQTTIDYFFSRRV